MGKRVRGERFIIMKIGTEREEEKSAHSEKVCVCVCVCASDHVRGREREGEGMASDEHGEDKVLVYLWILCT